MEQFFTATRRLHATVDYAEVQLRSTTTVDKFLIQRWGWKNLCAFVPGNGDKLRKILWLTEDVFLEVGDVVDFTGYGYEYSLHAVLTAASGREQALTLHQQMDKTLSAGGACSVF